MTKFLWLTIILFIGFQLDGIGQNKHLPVEEWFELTSSQSSINIQDLTLDKSAQVFKISEHNYILFLKNPVEFDLPEHIKANKLTPEKKIATAIFNSSSQDIIDIQIKTAELSSSEINRIITKYNLKNLDPSWAGHHIIKTAASLEEILHIATEPSVLWIDLSGEDTPLDEEVIGITNAKQIMPHGQIPGLTGKNITVGIGDNADVMHVDLQNRLTSYNPSGAENHGEHVTGTVAGNGNKDIYGSGYAPNAYVISDYFSQIIAKTPQYATANDLTVTNNSYGSFLGDCSYMGTYNSTSQTMDEIAINHDKVLHIFAAANDGNFTCPPYPQGYKTVNGGFASAKNTLVVANMLKYKVGVRATSSRGPTSDGRIKPEITAIGTSVYGPLKNNNYGNSTGTSMAAPNVAGIAVLLQEFYKDSISNNIPIHNSLLKNILINGSTHLLTEGPNYQYGYGLVNAKESKRILQEGTYWEDTIQSNSSKTFTFQVPNNTTEFRVLLNWNDPAAHPNAEKALVHDLDLKIIDPNNAIYLPWVLNPLSDQVESSAIRSIDTLNNVEQVSILNPIPGTYTIEVSAASLLENKQDFALSYIIEDSHLELHYPVNNLSLDIDKKLHFYWENSKDLTGNTALYYSIDNQSTWIPIKTDISDSKRDYEWSIPSSLANYTLQFKIVKDNKEQILTDGVFFSKRPEIFTPDINQQCWGSIKFNWAPLVDIDSYAVYLLTDKEIKIVDTTTSTSYKFIGLQADKTYWYAVAPIFNGKIGIRSVADYLKPQGTSCEGNGTSGDLTILKSDDLPFGREATSNILTNNEEIPVRIKNISNATIGQFRLHYSINNSGWEYQDFIESLSPNEEKTVYISNINLAQPNFYTFNLAIENLEQLDPVPSNDSLSLIIAHLENPEIDLSTAYIEDFENWSSFDERETRNGLNLHNAWDLFPHSHYGRAYITDINLWAINGEKSLSLDNYRNITQEIADSSQNILRATWNLGLENAYQSEIKLKFNYILHKENTNGNKIQIRGSDTDNWIDAYLFPSDEDSAYSIQNSPNISLSKLLKDNNQNFSSSFQMQLIQRDSTKISHINYGTGITIDDIEIHKVFNDLELKTFYLNDKISCENNSFYFKVDIENHVNNTVFQVPVSIYNGDSLLISENIDSIEALSILSYTFQTEFITNLEETYSLYAVVHHPADSYAYNDTSDIILIRQQKTINDYPYFENFDTNDGGYFSFGKNNSWEYGQINSIDLKNPYEENKSWKTNLTGYSNSQEHSYLYSPCFDIGSLQSPYLSFMASYSFSDYNLEEDTVLDYARIEYSYDGEDWQTIPELQQYYIYHHNENLWTNKDLTWRPYTIQIPQEEEIVQFRWVIKNESGASKEGLAIDNIHVYDYKYPIGTFDGFSAEKEVQSNEEKWGVENQELSFIVPENNDSYLKINSFLNPEAKTEDGLAKLYSQMWTIKPLDINDFYSIQLAVLDSLLEEDKSECYSCKSRSSIYDYAFHIYSGAESHINKEIKDNTDNKWEQYFLKDFTIIPYGKGYLVELKAQEKGEIWLLNSSLIKRENPNKGILNWTLNHFDENGAIIKWEFDHTIIDAISSIQVMNFTYNESFENRKQKFIEEEARVVDYPDIINNIARYKLRITTKDNQIFYTPEKSLLWDDKLFYWKLFPNPNKGPDLNLFYAINSLKPVYFEIIQSDGKIIERKTLNLKEQTGHLKIPSSHLMNGSYFLKIIQSDKEKVFPFIKL